MSLPLSPSQREGQRDCGSGQVTAGVTVATYPKAKLIYSPIVAQLFTRCGFFRLVCVLAWTPNKKTHE